MKVKTNADAQRPGRRSFATMALALGALAATPRARGQAQTTQVKPGAAANPARTSLHYELEYNASPQRIYDALLEPKQFASFSGLSAEIDARPGGAFSLFGGMIVGRNVELVPARRIVQAWRPAHWDAGVYSIVRFELKPRAAVSTLVLDHTGFPEGLADSLDQGWHAHYIDGLRTYVA